MARITPKGDAARLFLIDHPEFQSPRSRKPPWEYDDTYANRLASGGRKQIELGLTPNKQALRGHVLTPEHGRAGATPKLPETPVAYRQLAQRIRDTRLGAQTPSAPAQRVRRAVEGLEGKGRPLVHRRERAEGRVPFEEHGEIYTRNTEAGAREILRYAAAIGQEAGQTHGERVVLTVFDCSRRIWAPVFRNRGHGRGISADVLLTLARDHGGSFEQFLLDTVNDAAYRDSGRLSHICQYEITILPRETAAVKRLREQVNRHH